MLGRISPQDKLFRPEWRQRLRRRPEPDGSGRKATVFLPGARIFDPGRRWAALNPLISRPKPPLAACTQENTLAMTALLAQPESISGLSRVVFGVKPSTRSNHL